MTENDISPNAFWLTTESKSPNKSSKSLKL